MGFGVILLSFSVVFIYIYNFYKIIHIIHIILHIIRKFHKAIVMKINDGIVKRQKH